MTDQVTHNEKKLNEHAEDYIAYKLASGYKFDKQAGILRRFCKYAEEWEPGLTTVTKDVAEKWAFMSPDEAPTNQQHRMNTVKLFSKYLISNGIPSYIYPNQKWVVSSFQPYIFSDDELSRFFSACDNTKTPNLVRADVVSLIFRMIYSCGLRSSEAINLTVRDVDLVQGTIFIKETKFDKERLLPVHDALLARMKKYHKKIHSFSGPDTPYFPHKLEGSIKPYTTTSLYSIFRERLWAAYISHGGKGNGPRLHDLRHTFAVHSLRKAVKEGKDVNAMLKYLSVYLGHVDVVSSQKYLRLTADMFPDIVCRMEKDFDIIPKGVDDYESN